jgi:hypothetical protein
MSTTPAGLCERCRHCKRVGSTRGSVFWMCQRHDGDPSFAKYPRLPVVACRGYEEQAPSSAQADEGEPRRSR